MWVKTIKRFGAWIGRNKITLFSIAWVIAALWHGYKDHYLISTFDITIAVLYHIAALITESINGKRINIEITKTSVGSASRTVTKVLDDKEVGNA